MNKESLHGLLFSVSHLSVSLIGALKMLVKGKNATGSHSGGRSDDEDPLYEQHTISGLVEYPHFSPG